VWSDLEPQLGTDSTNRTRFETARRTCALRWFAAFWKQRRHRESGENSLVNQHPVLSP